MAGTEKGCARRALIYIRVSTARDDMISPELQQYQGETLAAKEGMQLVGKPIMDLGKTGRSFGERQISKIIGMAEREEFDVLILWVWSRFGRNMKDSLTNLDRLTELGIEVRAVKEDFDGRTNIGRFAIRQMLNIAELFSDVHPYLCAYVSTPTPPLAPRARHEVERLVNAPRLTSAHFGARGEHAIVLSFAPRTEALDFAGAHESADAITAG
ncbi:recombinase family protein [Streptomyces sp. NBC_01363]|uniref:recombinase family protein n=1 Tax=Streptomyces sp. NBC_01363 TaxID=2903840 RepID=UPI0022563676|nr:recombinase family protein [Streptomyces sp. NBC_01363]MCX4733318.1 recombinase family protein [Streptomyces sp. NBC_01363]